MEETLPRDRPMVLAVLGDFGGQSRRLLRVDRDNLDAVLARMGLTVEVPGGTLRIAAMDDFHPDAFAARLPGTGASEPPMAGASAALPTARPDPPDATAAGATGATGSLLDAILDAPAGAPPAGDAVREYARQVAAPSTVQAAPAPRHRELEERVRAVLYAPRFQTLEAAWRGLAALVAEAETGVALEVRVLAADRDHAPMLLAEELATPGAPRPSCVLAAYTFGPSEHDLAVLERFGAVALAAGVPFVADASPALLGLRDARELGDPSVRQRIGLGAGPDAWRAFRSSAAATNVMLCLPRVLLRAPYGPGDVETFPFDEALTGRDHERFLWGSAALAHGRVLARAFAAEGWEAELGRSATLEGLPVYVWLEGGEECVLPCAEVVMSEATIARVVEEGLVVLAGVRGEDRVVVRLAG